MNRELLRLYFVAGSQDCRQFGDGAEQLLKILDHALKTGVSCFQFRDKGEHSLMADPSAQKMLAIDCQKLCKKHNKPFILNDRAALAFEIGADGIHVGQSDQSILEIDKKSQGRMILGLSINTLAQAHYWDKVGAVDYFGVGPIFPTLSKKDHQPAVGLDFPKLLKSQGIKKPMVAIGGITAKHSERLRADGVDGIAVVSAIANSGTGADQVQSAVQALL